MFTQISPTGSNRRLISFILIICLIFTLPIIPIMGTGTKVYAATPATINMNSVAGDVTVTRDASKIYAAVGRVTFTSGAAADGLVITGESDRYNVSIRGTGNPSQTTSKFNVTLSSAEIDITGLSKGALILGNGAAVDMTLTGDNVLSAYCTTSSAIGFAGLQVSSPSTITIGGTGSLLATGGFNGAGIGGGFSEDSGKITIGGNTTVTAIAGSNGAGIGGGINGDGSNITILGQTTVVASGSVSGAGIGGGSEGVAVSIKITENSNVTATSGGHYLHQGNPLYPRNESFGAAIGGGSRGFASDILIDGHAEVYANSLSEGAGIGGSGGGLGGAGDELRGSGQNITIAGNADVYAFSGKGAGIGGGSQGLGGNIKVIDNASVTAISGVRANEGAGIGGGLNSKARDIRISDNAKVVAKSFNAAGIGSGRQGSAENILIDGGTVYAQGGNRAAGIGGALSSSAIGITISGGAIVKAIGGTSGAGIGSGAIGNFGGMPIGKDIKINSGTVYASGGAFAAGIGGSLEATGRDITINGGFVTAIGDVANGADDIGNGQNSSISSSGIKILGGSVYLFNNKFGSTPTGISGAPVFKVTVPAVYTGSNNLLHGNQDISVPIVNYTAKTISSGSVEHESTFPKKDAAAYIYLPAGAAKSIFVGVFPNGFANVKAAPSALTDNIVLWDNPIPINFDGGNADEEPASIAITYGSLYSDYGQLPVATKAGYTFDSWRYSLPGGNEVEANHVVDSLRPVTLYALWNAQKYNVTFSAIGATVGGISKEAIFGNSYGPLPVATKSAYTFKGWYTSSNGGVLVTSGSIVKTPANHYLYAQWTGNAYVVTFDKNGGNPPSFLTKSAIYGEAYGSLPDVTKNGSIFKGWYTASSGGIEITSGSIFAGTGPQTLYAQWKAKDDEKPPITTPSGWNPFVDVKEDDWFHDDVKYVWENGLMVGTSEDEFSPDIFVTRDMVATTLWRMAGEPSATTPAPFKDLEQDWYKEAVAWAAENKIIFGYSDGRFGPGDPVLRQQLVAMLWRYAEVMGIDTSVGDDTNILSYKDALKISTYAIEPFQWTCGAEITKGSPSGYLNPLGYAKRSEFAAMLHRLLEG